MDILVQIINSIRIIQLKFKSLHLIIYLYLQECKIKKNEKINIKYIIN